ncbi:MAG: M50 family metallopeptidase [Patescibacteria group bacterium]
MIWTILLFLLLLSVLVLVHEWGHYFAAKRSGMAVEEFGIGFPPRVFGWKGKSGTVWSVNAIPLGGFVKIKGESGENADAPDSFASQSWLKRFVVIIAGVIMNLVLAWALFTAGFVFGLPAVVEGGVEDGVTISDRAVNIVDVLPGSAADEAGLQIGDRLLTVDDTAYETGPDAREALKPHEDATPLSLMIVRHGETQTVSVTPEYVEELGRDGVGVSIVETGFIRYPWYLAPWKGLQTTVTATWDVLSAFGGLIASVFHREDVSANLSGPVGIAVLTGQVASLGGSHLVQFAAMLSINLAVINVLPLPALDGGRLAFLLYELIRRKKATPGFEQAVHAIGFAFLLLVVLVVTVKDIVHLF